MMSNIYFYYKMYGYATELHKIATGIAYFKWTITTISSFIYPNEEECGDIILIEIVGPDGVNDAAEGPDEFYKLSIF